jgi:radical SAM superfamily enzyme YgiQ (UPF0313 family)
MRVLLYNPKPMMYDFVDKEECCSSFRQEPWLPSQMVLAAAYLRQKGWEADLVDAQVDERHVSFEEYDCVVVWLSTFFSLFNDIAVLRRAKEAGARTVLVLNDPPDALEREVLEMFPFIDAAVRLYEREVVLERLLAAWKNGERPPAGVVYRSGEGVVDTGVFRPLDSCEHLGSAAEVLSSMKLDAYGGAYLTTGRGCGNGCAFCLFRKSGTRKRKVADIAAELSVISGTVRGPLYLLDLNLLADRKWALRLSDGIKGFGAEWFTDATAVLCSSESLQAIRRAGCSRLTIGAESADEHVLSAISKPVNLAMLERSAQNCRGAGIRPHFTFILGFPWDDAGAGDKYIRLIKRLRPCESSFQYLLPLRGTPIYDMMRSMGYFEELHVWEYFGKGIDHPMFGTNHLSRQELKTMKRRIEIQTSPMGHLAKVAKEFWDLGITGIPRIHAGIGSGTAVPGGLLAERPSRARS